jgi:hypothetical protein
MHDTGTSSIVYVRYWYYQYYSSIWQFDTSGQSIILTVNLSSLHLPLVLGSAQSCQITLPIYIKLPVLLNEEYWSFQYCVFHNTSITSIAGWRILELPVLCIDQRFWYSSIVNARYWYIHDPVLYMYDTGIHTSIVKHTILEAPVFFIQQYW